MKLRQEIEHAIQQSIRENRRVRLDVQSLDQAFDEVCVIGLEHRFADQEQYDDGVEAWGEDEDGKEWRIWIEADGEQE